MEYADSERKASWETFGRATDESGDMAPDEDREAVEISRDSRNRETVTTEYSWVARNLSWVA